MAIATATMKAVVLDQYGGPDNLEYKDFPVPHPSKGEALIRVRAASVNPVDYKLAAGTLRQLTFPHIPGRDFAGIIEDLGPDAVGFAKGDPVFGDCDNGAYAQFVIAPVGTVAPKPSTLNFVQAASVPLAAQTAWQGLFDHGQLESGRRVLIHAAAGGVGSWAVQFAKWKDAFVVATASSENAEYVKSLGADQVIDYKSTPFESAVDNIDLVLDLVGGDTADRSFKVLKPGGRLISSLEQPSQDLARRHNVHAMAFYMEPSSHNLIEIANLIDSGKIRAPQITAFPLAKVKDAWNRILSGKMVGKIVLEIPD